VNDAFFKIRSHKQPLRALMYEKLIWTHLFGIHAKDVFSTEPAGVGEFKYHENGSIRTILGVIGFLVIVEGIAIDMFVATKSVRLAIGLGIVHFFMLLYAVALIRASSQRPVQVTPDGILVRISLLFCAWLPFASIEKVTLIEREVERKNTPNTLWCAVGDQPNVCIQMSKCVDALLPLGILRRPTRLYIYVDTPTVFVVAVENSHEKYGISLNFDRISCSLRNQ
jgi:hypothetical protein